MKQSTVFAKLILLLALVGALALAGCGGDDGGLSAADQARLDQAEADRLAELARNTERTGISAAIEAATAAVGDVDNASTDAEVSAAEAAITAATAAISGATAISDAEKANNNAAVAALTSRLDTAKASRMAAMDAADRAALIATERTGISAAIEAARNAVRGVNDASTDTDVSDAEDLISAAATAILQAPTVSDAEKANYRETVGELRDRLDTANDSRMAAAGRMERIANARQAIATAETAADAQAAYDVVKDDVTVAEGVELQRAVDMRTAELETMARVEMQMTALTTAAGNVDTSDLMTADDIATATAAIAALRTALAGAVDVSDADKATYQAMLETAEAAVMTAQGNLDHAAQMTVLTNAVDALKMIDLSALTTQDAVDAAKAAIAGLQTALDGATELSDAEKAAAMADLATADRTVMAAQDKITMAGQMMALSDAVDALKMVDLSALTTQAQIDEAQAAILALNTALADATELSTADKSTATFEAELARRRVMAAQTALDDNIAGQREALTMAGTALAALDLDALDTAEKVAAASSAITALKAALEGATHVSDADKAMYQTAASTAETAVMTAQSALDHAAQTMALTMAVADLKAIDLSALTTQAAIDAADVAIAALKAALEGATELSAAEKTAAMVDLAAAERTVMTAQGRATIESQRMALRIAWEALDAVFTGPESVMTQAQIDAVEQALSDFETALAATTALDLSDREKFDATGHARWVRNELANAKEYLADNIAGQRMALSNAGTALGELDLDDLDSADKISAAQDAIAALKAALEGATHLSDADKAMYMASADVADDKVMAAQSALDRAAQMMAVTDAVTTLQDIDLTGLTTQAAIDEAEAAIEALKMALNNGTELSDADKAAAMIHLAAAERGVLRAQGRVDVAGQLTMLTTAVATLAAIDLDDLMTQEKINTAEQAVIGLETALNAANDLTDAQKLDATVNVTVARRRVAAAQIVLDGNIQTQRTAVMEAVEDLNEIDLDDLDTAEKIMAADEAVKALKTALDMATHLSDADKAMYRTQLDDATEDVRMAQTGMDRSGRMAAQRTALEKAVMALTTAVSAVNDTATDVQVMAADDAVTALQAAIDGAEDLEEGDADLAGAKRTLAALTTVLGNAKTSRMTAIERARKAAEAGMVATALRLHTGIGAQSVTGTNTTDAGTALTGATDRAAAYNNVDIPTTGTALDTRIMVGIGTNPVVDLPEDKKATVADNHGWKGKRYYRKLTTTIAAPHQNDTYEAIVYSNVGEPVMGLKFGSLVTDPEFQYVLVSGMVTVDTTTAPVQMRVASSMFDQSSGIKTFKLPANNVAVQIPGMYHGVSGTYSCTPTAPAICASQVAADGFELGTVASATSNVFTVGTTNWTFKPTDPNARVSDMPDQIYASYGWWIYTDASNNSVIASAFVDDKGAVAAAADITALQGTATYMGGAAGKYAIHSASATGGTNDAGHFTARATLEADFDDDMITGTIDNFIGADGQSRNWKVELMEQGVGDTGQILGDDGSNGGTPKLTKWTIDGATAPADGQWLGFLKDTADIPTDRSGVPKVATGTFYSTYNNTGKMVGGFGVNKQ